MSLSNVDEVKDDPSLGAHYQIQVAQADIEVNDNDLLTLLRERCAERCRRSGLADTALSGCYDKDLTHSFLLCGLGQRGQFNGIMI
jgi:hypothetical protein